MLEILLKRVRKKELTKLFNLGGVRFFLAFVSILMICNDFQKTKLIGKLLRFRVENGI